MPPRCLVPVLQVCLLHVWLSHGFVSMSRSTITLRNYLVCAPSLFLHVLHLLVGSRFCSQPMHACRGLALHCLLIAMQHAGAPFHSLASCTCRHGRYR